MALTWKSGGGADLPNGGTKGQALVKKSDANQDVEWGNAGSGIVDQTYDPTSTNAQSGTAVAEALEGVQIPSGWGIANVAKISISLPAGNNSATQTIDISDFGFESGDDYTVLCNIYNGTGDWAKAITNVGSQSATSFMLIVKCVASDITRVDVEYIIIGKGYGDNVSGWGVAKKSVVQIPNNGGEWGEATIDVSELGLTSAEDYTASLLVAGGAGGYGGVNTYIKNKTAQSFVIHWARVSGGSATRVDYEYTIIAKGYGGSGGPSGLPGGGTTGQMLTKISDDDGAVAWRTPNPSLPAGGTTEQILAKKSDADDDAEWVDDTGKYLMKEERPYGYHEETRQVPHTTVEWQTDISSSYFTFTAHQYQVGGTYTPPHLKLAAAGSYASIEFLWTAIRNSAIPVSKGAVRVVCNAGELLKNGTQKTQSGYTFYPVKVGNSTFYLRTSNPVSSKDADLVSTITTDTTFDISSVCTVSLSGIHSEKGVEKTTYTEETVQVTDYIHNVTGVVLDDLKVTGNAVPTDWGVASSGKLNMTRVESGIVGATLNVSSFNFESADDYAISIIVRTGADGAWGDSRFFYTNKTATSATLRAYTGSNTTAITAEYALFAKGYGNTTMSAPNAILESPNGTKYKLKVANDGTLSTEAV